MADISAYVNFADFNYDDLVSGGVIDHDDHNAVRASIESYYDSVFLSIVTDLQNNYASGSEPGDKPEGKVWADTTSDPAVLKYYKDGATNLETLVGLTLSQTLTNKTLASPDIDGGTIDDVTLGGTLAGDFTFGGNVTHATTKNLLLNAATAPASLAGGLAMLNGTAASAGLTNGFSMWSADKVAGHAGPHFMSEGGEILSWGNEILDLSSGVADADRIIKFASAANLIWDDGESRFEFFNRQLRVLSLMVTQSAPSAPNLNTLYTDSLVKGWVRWTGNSTTILDDYNVSSMTDHGPGDFTVNWDTNFTTTNYAVICGGYEASQSVMTHMGVFAMAVGTTRVLNSHVNSTINRTSADVTSIGATVMALGV